MHTSSVHVRRLCVQQEREKGKEESIEQGWARHKGIPGEGRKFDFSSGRRRGACECYVLMYLYVLFICDAQVLLKLPLWNIIRLKLVNKLFNSAAKRYSKEFTSSIIIRYLNLL